MKAYEVIDSPDKWTTGNCFADQYGEVCAQYDAVKYCVLGAMSVAYGPFELEKQISRLEEYLESKGKIKYSSVWNDEVGYEEVYDTLKELDI